MPSASPKNRSINVILSFGKKRRKGNCDYTGGTFDSWKKWCNSSPTHVCSFQLSCVFSRDRFWALWIANRRTDTRLPEDEADHFFSLCPRFVLSSSKCGIYHWFPHPHISLSFYICRVVFPCELSFKSLFNSWCFSLPKSAAFRDSVYVYCLFDSLLFYGNSAKIFLYDDF